MQIILSWSHDLASRYRQILATSNVTDKKKLALKNSPPFRDNPYKITGTLLKNIKKSLNFEIGTGRVSAMCVWVRDRVAPRATPAVADCGAHATSRSPRPPKKYAAKIWREAIRKNWRGALYLGARLYANPSCAPALFSGVGVGMQLKSRACVWGRD